jgi:hypothetical protein
LVGVDAVTGVGGEEEEEEEEEVHMCVIFTN